MTSDSIKREIKCHPIIFSGESVRLILSGAKNQTRRVIGLDQLMRSETRGYDWTFRGQSPIRSIAQQRRYVGGCWQDIKHNRLISLCPYGSPGDRIYWANEPIEISDIDNDRAWIKSLFDGKRRICEIPRRIKRPSVGRWRGRKLPREWRRIDFSWPITDVRVQRVQEISDEDIAAEGIPWDVRGTRAVFAQRWDELNAKRGHPWASNDWVWAITFRKAE